MAGKAVESDITAEGFQPAMFGVVAGSAWTTYLAPLLLRASNWASMRVTAINYGAAGTSGYAFDCLVRAEIAYVAETLWTRRLAFIDGQANAALQDDQRAARWKQALANAAAAGEDMTFWIGEAQRTFGMDVQADVPGTGVSSGVVETGRFRQTDTTALNFTT